ncbi:histidine phosphatase family protein [Candidatus Woesearchaeota archaeon]|nr:histidine phosphatase family protein [Candidatus Woesearchaeota archaeon]
MSINVIVTRHGQKEDPIKWSGEKTNFGSDEDNKLPLSAKGVLDCARNGAEIIKPDMAQVLAFGSKAYRTRQTGEAMLLGAGYDPASHGGVQIKEGLGALCEIDMGAEESKEAIARWGAGDETGFHILAMENNYLPTVGKPQVWCVAQSAYGLLDTLLEGIYQLRESEDSGLICVTHGGFIEALTASVEESLKVSDDGSTEVKDFSGAFGEGEYIKAEVIDPQSQDPTVVFQYKDRHCDQKLSALEEMRDTHAYHAGVKKAE